MPNDPSSKPESAPDGAQRPARRRFSDRDKLRIPEAADRCSCPGEVGILLRRAGADQPAAARSPTRIPEFRH
jgi:hypothetical protein